MMGQYRRACARRGWRNLRGECPGLERFLDQRHWLEIQAMLSLQLASETRSAGGTLASKPLADKIVLYCRCLVGLDLANAPVYHEHIVYGVHMSTVTARLEPWLEHAIREFWARHGEGPSGGLRRVAEEWWTLHNFRHLE